MNSFVKKGLKGTFYFEKKTIHNKCVICDDNKQKSRLIIVLYEVIFSKINILYILNNYMLHYQK